MIILSNIKFAHFLKYMCIYIYIKKRERRNSFIPKLKKFKHGSMCMCIVYLKTELKEICRRIVFVRKRERESFIMNLLLDI